MHLRAVLLPRRGLHAAGDIDAVGGDARDAFGDVLRRQSAGDDDGLAELFCSAGELPGEALARSAEHAGDVSVEVVGSGALVSGELREIRLIAQAEGPDRPATIAGDDLRALAALELD